MISELMTDIARLEDTKAYVEGRLLKLRIALGELLRIEEGESEEPVELTPLRELNSLPESSRPKGVFRRITELVHAMEDGFEFDKAYMFDQIRQYYPDMPRSGLSTRIHTSLMEHSDYGRLRKLDDGRFRRTVSIKVTSA